MDDCKRILRSAVNGYRPVAIYALFSGGDDSLTATHVAASVLDLTAVVHINTGIGIEETRQFVRDTCERRAWPLLEMHPDAKTYDELVLAMGFPHGPRSHATMYYWLKQRQVRRLVREAKARIKDRVMLVTGIRVRESSRRMGRGISVEVRREGAQVWVNPILWWDKRTCLRYLQQHDIPRNPASELLHRSGECLCGAFAHRDEIKEIELWFPEAARRIHALEAQVRERGLVDDTWAATSRGPGRQRDPELPLCSDCPSGHA